MSFTINNSSADLLAANLRTSTNLVSRDVSRLSSGTRFTRAADDIASQAISSTIETQLTKINAATNNVSQAKSLLRTAEGGLQNIINVLQRMQSLASSASSGALSDNDRSFLNIEFQQLKQQVEYIATRTKFNEIPVLDGVGLSTEERVQVTSGIFLDGTFGQDTLAGSNITDFIRGFESNDIIEAGLGDDIIQAGLDLQPGLTGTIYQSGPFLAITGLNEAEQIVAQEPVAGTFISTALDYPRGAVNSTGGNINSFLGPDTATLSNPALGTVSNRYVIVFEGLLRIPADGDYDFGVQTDDGFSLQIDGIQIDQQPTNRGFNAVPDTSTVTLTKGLHPVRFLFWENGGGSGMEVTSSLNAGGILDNTTSSYSFLGLTTDGNDVVNGGEGYDTAVFTGDFNDYTINILSPNQVQITDNRSGSPDGLDIFTNVEQFQFGDITLQFSQLKTFENIIIEEGVLKFDVAYEESELFEYDIVDATLDAIFADPDNLKIVPVDEALNAIVSVADAINQIISKRSYVGSLQSRADYIQDNLATRFINQDASRSELKDTNVAAVSTQYTQYLAQQSLTISMVEQSNQILRDNILAIYEGIFSQSSSNS